MDEATLWRALTLVGMGAFVLMVVLPGLRRLTQGSDELGMPPMSALARKGLHWTFGLVGAGLILGGVLNLLVAAATG